MTVHNSNLPAPRLVVNNADGGSRPALSRRGSSASSSSQTSASAASERVSAWAQGGAVHAVAPDSVAVTKFSADVASLMKRTQVARNVLPMIVRGGAIASVGMLLFGHFAPIAILGTLLGALVGGYLIAKFMQLRLSKQMQSGADATLLDSIRQAPEGASAADIAHQQQLLSFIEGGNVFKTGVAQAYAQPFKAMGKRFAAAANAVQARSRGAMPAPVRPGSTTLTEAGDRSDAGSFLGDDDEKEGSVAEEATRPTNENRRYSAEEKGKGRADVDLRSSQPSSATLVSLNSEGEQKVGLLSDDEDQSLRTPVLQPSPAKATVPQISRSPSIKSMQASIGDLEPDGEDEAELTPKAANQA